MNIGIDIDDTITDTYETCLAYAQRFILQDLNKTIQLTDEGNIPHSYHYAEILHLTELENLQFLKKYIKIILEETKPKTFASKYLYDLHKENNHIILITSRHEENRMITQDWLKKHKIYYDELIMHCESKENALKEHEIDIFIDDNLHYCKQSESNGIKTFMMDTRPNRNIHTSNIKRVYSWPHLYSEIRKV